MRSILGLGVAVLLSLAVVSTASGEHVLRYDRPARTWASEALPLGNGRLGCMVFGGVELERIQFNEDSLWTGDANPSGDYDTMGAYQAFGDLLIDFDAAAAAADGYERSLSLDRAVATTTFRRGDVTHARTVFASHPDQVVVVRWAADKSGSVSGRIRLAGTHGEKPVAEGAALRFAGKLSNGLEYEAAARIIAKGGRAEADGDAVRLLGCDEVVILLAAGTSYAMDNAKGWRGEHPKARLAALLEAAAKRPYADLLGRHVADHRRLFDRVEMAWGKSAPEVSKLTTDRRLDAYRRGGEDPDLEQTLVQYGRYLLIASSRRPGLPANLQGLWNDSNKPPWSSDYHTNINVQMNYWPAETANLAECHLPLFDLVMAMREPSRKATRAAFGEVRGWTARTSHNVFGGHGWQWNIPASAWYAQHFFEHWAFGRDERFAREVALPMLREVCEFWEDHLKRLPDGTLVVPNGWSPEHGPREDGVAHDQQIVWDLFTNYVELATAIGADAAYRAKVAAMREKLAGPRVGKWGQLQEWMADRDDPKDQHRHTSHLFAVYPGRQISVTGTPEWAKAARVSLEARGTSGDSRREWAWAWRCAMWARLREGEKCHEMMRGLLAHNTLVNLLGNHPPMQMDGNWGIAAAACEMLLQSHAGEVHLLPALPKAWAAEGSFRGLRARGGFEVSAEWKEGRVTSWRITSDEPRPLKLRVNGQVREVISERTPLAFVPEGRGGYRFDTGILRGQLRSGGKSIGLSDVVHVPTGKRLSKSMGLLSPYRLLDADARYGVAAWEWASEATLREDGVVVVTWKADAEHPFGLTGVYRLAAADAIDVELAVTPKKRLRGFELFLASYFDGFERSFVRGLDASQDPAWIEATKGEGEWQTWAADEMGMGNFYDGRWERPPHPVAWRLRGLLAPLPMAMRRDGENGLTAVLAGQPGATFAISTPYGEEGHRSVYLSLFGGDLGAGERASARVRLIVARGLDDDAAARRGTSAFTSPAPDAHPANRP